MNAGLIGEEEAKKRRAEVTQEADFYGSMDGALHTVLHHADQQSADHVNHHNH
jgi:flagellar biosynthesis component FlhA